MLCVQTDVSSFWQLFHKKFQGWPYTLVESPTRSNSPVVVNRCRSLLYIAYLITFLSAVKNWYISISQYWCQRIVVYLGWSKFLAGLRPPYAITFSSLIVEVAIFLTIPALAMLPTTPLAGVILCYCFFALPVYLLWVVFWLGLWEARSGHPRPLAPLVKVDFCFLNSRQWCHGF